MASLFSLRRRFLCHLHGYNCSSRFNLSTISFYEAKSKLEREYDPEKLVTAYESMLEDFDYSAVRYASKVVIRRLAKARRFTDIETLLEKQKQSPKSRDEAFFSCLIYAYGRAGMVDQAIRTFDQMDELGTPRSSRSFNELLNACNASKNFDKVPKLFDEIPKKYGISPDKISYGILLKALCESGLPESGYLILSIMEKSNIEITPVAYTTLLDGFYKKNKIEDARKIWDDMCKKGFNLSLHAYTVKLSHVAFHGTPDEALKLLDEMATAGMKPDTVAYNYLITCYCRNGRIEDAKKVYEGLEGNGCAPDLGTFKHLIIYLCKGGDYDFAFELGKESIKRNKVPDFGTMKLLIQGLAERSRLECAKEFLSEVKDKFPPTFENAWRKVEIGLAAKLSAKEEAT